MHKERLSAGLEHSPTDILVVPLERLGHIGKRESVLQQRFGRDDDVVLLLVATPRVDLGNPCDLAELWLDDPVVERSKLDEPSVRVLGAKHVVEDFTKPRGDWAELGALDAFGELNRREALSDVLASVRDVGRVVEGGDNLREPELGDGANVRKPWKTTNG